MADNLGQVDSSDADPGQLLAGKTLDRYRIVRKLSAGGFGITYLAEHLTLGKSFALKEHFPRQMAVRDGVNVRPMSALTGDYRWALQRFKEEAVKLALFKHANIVDVTDVFEANGTAYMVMALEAGTTMKTWLETLGRPPHPEELDHILFPILDALEFIHAEQYLHRDIAPDNIMVRPDGSPCLIDFGAARQAMGEISKTLTTIVKPGYSPIEQYDTEGSDSQGAWTDIYALGATLYRSVTGNKPPEAPGRLLNDRYVPASQSAPAAYRQELLVGIDLALRIRPHERPQDIGRLRQLVTGSKRPPVPPPDATERINWQLVKQRRVGSELREHLARFAGGATAAEARALLEEVVWEGLGARASLAELNSFLAEFPNGAHASEALGLRDLRLKELEAHRRAAEAAAKRRADAAVSGAKARQWRFPLTLAVLAIGALAPLGVLLGPRLLGNSLSEDTTALTRAPQPVKPQQASPQLKQPPPAAIPSPSAPPAPKAPALSSPVRLVATFSPGKSWITKVRLAPDASRVVVGYDTKLRVYGVVSGAEQHTFDHKSFSFNAIIMAPDGQRLYASTYDDQFRVFDLSSGRQITSLPPVGKVQQIALTPDGAGLLTTYEKTMTLWDLKSGRRLGTFVGHADKVIALAFSADGRHLVSGSVDNTLRHWEVASGRLIRTYNNPTGHNVWTVAISPDGRRIVGSGILSRYAKVWDAESGAEIGQLNGETGSFAFSPDGRLLARTVGRVAELYDAKTLLLLGTISDHSDHVFSLDFSADGKKLVTGGKDGTARMWELLDR